ncbi:hypothetical protein YQ44_26555 [Janthinobacterium sp. 1_2014MBL_MicDiv]|nr:hypothetical protein YQ44_26555 [Janthinobacterium sp. 1_2014MBL_MicDiv]
MPAVPVFLAQLLAGFFFQSKLLAGFFFKTGPCMFFKEKGRQSARCRVYLNKIVYKNSNSS